MEIVFTPGICPDSRKILKIHIAVNVFQDFFSRSVFTRIYTRESLLVPGTVSIKSPNLNNGVCQLYQFLPSSPPPAPFSSA